jgi:hypothetical protein
MVLLFAGTNISTSEEVAIKLESVKSKHPQLLYEYAFLNPLSMGPQFVLFLPRTVLAYVFSSFVDGWMWMVVGWCLPHFDAEFGRRIAPYVQVEGAEDSAGRCGFAERALVRRGGRLQCHGNISVLSRHAI